MKRDKLLPQIRVTREELDMIHVFAEKMGVSVSEYLRTQALTVYMDLKITPVRSSFCDKIARWFGR